MRSLVLYDSTYGNTQKIAETIAAVLKTTPLSLTQANLTDLQNLDLLVVGSPTQGGQATQSLQSFLKTIPPTILSNTKIAAFDTRIEESVQKLPLRLLMRLIGYAAPKIKQLLVSKGAVSVSSPQGYIVIDTKGPLKDGQLIQAQKFARSLSKSIR